MSARRCCCVRYRHGFLLGCHLKSTCLLLLGNIPKKGRNTALAVRLAGGQCHTQQHLCARLTKEAHRFECDGLKRTYINAKRLLLN